MSEQNDPGSCLWATNPPPTSLRGIQEQSAAWGYPTHQPEPCSSLHHAQIVDAGFRTPSFLLLAAFFPGHQRCHTTFFAMGIWNVSCSPAPSPDRVTPQSCHIRNSWRTPKNVIATDSHGLLKCIASSHRLSSMGLQMHFDGNLRLLDQRRSRRAIAPCLVPIRMPPHSPHPSERPRRSFFLVPGRACEKARL